MARRQSLQSLSSPHGFSSLLLHITGLYSFFGSFKYLVDYPSLINDAYGWHFQYLTIIGLAIGVVTFTLGIVADLTQDARFFQWKNTLSVCVTPLEVVISFLYWGLRTISKDLVLPTWAKLDFLPDLGFHLFPALLLSADYFLYSPPWTIRPLHALLLSATIAFGYWFWVEACYAHNGFYPYPIFAHLDTVGRIALFSLSAGLMTASTEALKKIYWLVHGDEKGGGAELKRRKAK